MASVTTFKLDEQVISVEDGVARETAELVKTQVTQLTAEVNEIKKLSRLQVTYSESESTITFSTKNHE